MKATVHVKRKGKRGGHADSDHSSSPLELRDDCRRALHALCIRGARDAGACSIPLILRAQWHAR